MASKILVMQVKNVVICLSVLGRGRLQSFGVFTFYNLVAKYVNM